MGSRRDTSQALQAAAAAVLMVDVFSACRCYFHGVVTVNGGCGWQRLAIIKSLVVIVIK